MTLRDNLELLLLAALWGASFLFMRVLAPVLGPWATADLRMLLGGAFLGVVFLFLRFHPGLKKNWKAFLVVGVVNSGLPFLLYSVGALVLPASAEAVLNALSPAFGAVAGALFLGERFTVAKALGLVSGFVGVLVIAGGLDLGSSPWAWAALVACLLAPVCYAAGGILTKRLASDIPPLALAFGSQFLAGLAFVPSLAIWPPSQPSLTNLGLVAVFGVLCSGLAYVLFFRLVQKQGPTRALAVTYLIPVFGVLWGALVLGEPLTVVFGVGSVFILLGTALVTSGGTRRAKPKA